MAEEEKLSDESQPGEIPSIEYLENAEREAYRALKWLGGAVTVLLLALVGFLYLG